MTVPESSEFRNREGCTKSIDNTDRLVDCYVQYNAVIVSVVSIYDTCSGDKCLSA